MIGRKVGIEEILKEIEKDVLFFDESGGGVTFSGGEPLSQPGFLLGTQGMLPERYPHRCRHLRVRPG